MNIAVFGWYHHRNAGDDRIQHCVTRWLDGHTLAFLPAGRPPSIDFLRTYDAVVIGGGGVIMSHGGMFRDMTTWVAAAGIPVALLGVSVERLPAALHQELRAFLDVCCVAWFRDQGSLDAIGSHPKAFVAPDLTWMFPFDTLPDTDAPTVAVALRAHAGLDVAAWHDALRAIGRPTVGWPLYFEGGGDAAATRRLLPGLRIVDEFSMQPLEQAGSVLSMRFHGVLFALQAGRPVIAVGSQPKLTRFMTEHGLADWVVAEDRLDELPARLDALQSVRPGVRRQALTIRDALHRAAHEAGERTRAGLLAAAEDAVARRSRWTRRVRAIFSASSRS
jgi:polysaccharide pyruvyl transferase WcaK-like protein